MLIWKGKGDIHDPGRYRGITLLSLALKLMERIQDARVRHNMESKIRENQLGFRKGTGTDDGQFTVRQIIDKRRAFRKDVAFGFVDLEKVLDTVPRAVVRGERETSEQYGVGEGLSQGSALSPLLFIMVMNLISGKMCEEEELKNTLYAICLAVVAENKEDLQKTLQEWSNTFRKHGLRMNMEKTEVMWIGEQEVDLY